MSKEETVGPDRIVLKLSREIEHNMLKNYA